MIYALFPSTGSPSLGAANNLGNGGLLQALGGAIGSNPAKDSSQTTLSALGQLQSASDAFQSALALLEPPYQTPSTQTSNSNPSVLTALSTGSAPSSSYAITVNSLAQAQSLQSASYSSDSDVLGSGTLTLSLGHYDNASNGFVSNGSAPVAIHVQNASLASVASAINAAQAGVTASVLQDNSGYRLVLVSSSTGSNQGFEVLSDNASLMPLSYDPSNPGAGGLSLSQSAQNASLSVNGVSLSSASNNNVTVGSGVSVNLLQTGSSTVQAQASSTNLQTQAQSVVSAFNTLQSTLANLQSGSGPAADIASLYAQALNTAATGRISNGSSSLTQLSQLGINFQPATGLAGNPTATTGGLSLDAGSFANAVNANSSGAQSLLSNAIQTLDTIASSFGEAGGTISSTQSAYQSAVSLDTLLSNANAPLQTSPSLTELASVQSGPLALNAGQISSVQQYATSTLPLLKDNFNGALLDLYVNSNYLSGSLLSKLA